MFRLKQNTLLLVQNDIEDFIGRSFTKPVKAHTFQPKEDGKTRYLGGNKGQNMTAFHGPHKRYTKANSWRWQSGRKHNNVNAMGIWCLQEHDTASKNII